MEFEISKHFVEACADIVQFLGDGEEYVSERLSIGIEPPNGAGSFRLMVWVKDSFVLDAQLTTHRGGWLPIPHYHVRAYHTGKWELYIKKHLWPTAIEGKIAYQEAAASADTLRRQKALEPIDDADIFPEVED